MIDGLTDIRVRCLQEMWELVFYAAQEDKIGISDWVLRLLAKRFNRKDLATIPKGRPGRPRNKKSRKAVKK